MDVSSISTDPNFFGKDNVVLFIGQVEDVNDPKRSGRVKVRCIGWHPPDKDKLSTEDLPWTRTCLPVTHSQQNRVGGKHGLIPGSWVIGVFADGKDANDGYAFCSFNFTVNTSEENNRTDEEAPEGTIPESIRGFKKINPITELNSGINTEEELKSGTDSYDDIAHDASSLDDSTSEPCAKEPSAFSKEKLDDKTATNPASQNINTKVGDGHCGNLQNGMANISDAISSMMPSGAGRITDGDGLFDMYGNAINLNGIMNKLSGIISSTLKDTIQKKKGFMQKSVNKIAHSTAIGGAATRSPITGELMDMVMSTQFDMMNSIIDRSLDQLQDLVMSSLQNLNNQKESSKGGENNTGDYGTSRSSSVLDLDSIDITVSILNDVEVSYNNTVTKAEKESSEYVKKMKDKIKKLDEKIQNTFPDDLDCIEDIEEDIENDADDIVNDIQISIGDDGGGGGDGGGGFDLGEASQFLQMVLNMDFTVFPQLFNKSGIAVLDSFTQSGCNPEDMYNTIMGYQGSMAGTDEAAGGGGGGSESGKSSKRDKDTYKDSGFAGKYGPVDENKTTYRPMSETIKKKKIKQSNRKKTLGKYKKFSTVDHHEPGRKYELKGEQTINNRKTNKNTVLLDNQDNPVDNGIWTTNTGKWLRPFGAQSSSDFSMKKTVSSKYGIQGKEGLFYYNGKPSPKLGYDDLYFSNLYKSNDFSQEEKDAFDPDVETKPDGKNARVALLSKPSSNIEAAYNFYWGIPNAVAVINPGKDYYYESKKPNRNYPSVFIKNYIGTPVPVVDPASGELVTILTNERSFGRNPDPTISIIPDNSSIGLSTDDPDIDLVVVSFFVANTGTRYSESTMIRVIDKDRDTETALVRPRIKNGRITSIEVINTGTGFRRVPRIKFENTGRGRGCRIHPIMGVMVKKSNPTLSKLRKNVTFVFQPTSSESY